RGRAVCTSSPAARRTWTSTATSPGGLPSRSFRTSCARTTPAAAARRAARAAPPSRGRSATSPCCGAPRWASRTRARRAVLVGALGRTRRSSTSRSTSGSGSTTASANDLA
ncbi:unnamed protein product, partial [Prorocentrum cordatum]